MVKRKTTQLYTLLQDVMLLVNLKEIHLLLTAQAHTITVLMEEMITMVQ